MCEETNCDILDVGTVAVVVGPGSFTGLRIGTAIAKALGCVNEKTKFIAVSSLELMAFVVANKTKVSGNFVCAINALCPFTSCSFETAARDTFLYQNYAFAHIRTSRT